MRKLEKNSIIITEIRRKINEAGLAGKLDVFPVENTFLRRPRYWVDTEGVRLFKVLMWDLNSLDGETLEQEINSRITAARRYFGI